MTSGFHGSGARQYGTSEPICDAYPTPQDLKDSELLIKFIDGVVDCFFLDQNIELFQLIHLLLSSKAPASTSQEAELKERILGRLSNIVQEWVRDVGLEKVFFFLISFVFHVSWFQPSSLFFSNSFGLTFFLHSF